MEKTEEVYSKLPFNLPAFTLLNKEFEIDDIESTFLLRDIRRHIIDKIEQYAKLIAELLHPEGSMMAMQEINNLSIETQNNLISIYQKAAYLIRKGEYIGMLHQDDQEASFILESYEQWPSLREKLSVIMEQLPHIWQQQTQKETTKEYFG